MTASTVATVVSIGAPQTTTTTTNNRTKTSTSCSLTAKYTVHGTDYAQVSSSASSNYCNKAVGSSISINYNPNEPTSWSTDVKSQKLFLSIFMYVGILVVIGSFFTFLIRLFSVIFGWKLLKKGRALAATLPSGTNLSTAIEQVKTEFETSLFNFSAGSVVEKMV